MGEREGDRSVLVEGHYVLGSNLAFSGDLDNGLLHLERAIELHDPRVHGSNRFRLGPNTGVVARVASGLLLWQSGEVDRGIGRVTAALELARQIDHPYSIAYATYHCGFLALGRYRFEEALTKARELSVVAEENDYPIWRTLATVLEGVSLTALGQPEKGLALTEAGIDLYRGLSAPPVFWPEVLNLRATVHALAGRPERALELIDEAIATDGGDPELMVSKGDFLMMLIEPDLNLAESVYRKASELALTRRARLTQLKALNRLVRLRRGDEGAPNGIQELAALYATFTEGFEEVELVSANEVISASA
jgi:tetratricopeptide (TPR) repeat protein